MAALRVNLDKLARAVNAALPATALTFLVLGDRVSFYFHFGTVTFFLLSLLNAYYRHGQTRHALLRNFGVVAQGRYVVESIGPELRQYLFATDLEEKPFNRVERSEVYRKAKGIDSSAAFGSQKDFGEPGVQLLHSAYPRNKQEVRDFELTFGTRRDCQAPYAITRPVMISAMSYGALSSRAIRALARGARAAGIAMNTGEGGYPKHHLVEGCDLIFQMGTAKFGVRKDDGTLDDGKLAALAGEPQVKMVEIKLSQGAKPGKGGLLPKEKITQEISELRGVPRGQDVVSPARHPECRDAASTVAFVRRVQEVCGLPVGIKLCLGRADELEALLSEMLAQGIAPDYLVVDGAEGGTGAAPRSFMDDMGVPLAAALPLAARQLSARGLNEHTRLIASGKLINPARQITAMARGADAVYSARGFLLALGCIQALQCNQNTCPVGITTHDERLTRGLDVDAKAERVRRYVEALYKDHVELCAALGCESHRDLRPHHVLEPTHPAFAVPTAPLIELGKRPASPGARA